MNTYAIYRQYVHRRYWELVFGLLPDCHIDALNVGLLRILARWILLGMIAVARGCRCVTEQPQSSLMTACACIRYVALVIRPIFWGEGRLPGSQCFDEWIKLTLFRLPSFNKKALMWWTSPKFTSSPLLNYWIMTLFEPIIKLTAVLSRTIKIVWHGAREVMELHPFCVCIIL